MKRFDLELFAMALQARAGLDERQVAVDVACATLAVFGTLLYKNDRARLAAALPITLAEALDSERAQGLDFGPDELYAQVGSTAGLPLAHAVEYAQVVLTLLAARFDADLMTFIAHRVPPSIDALLHPPVRDASPPPPSHVGQGRTLASGRAGASTPLAEAAPKDAQSHSVAANPDPHADSRLAAAPRAGGAVNSLAEGKVGSGRALSEADEK